MRYVILEIWIFFFIGCAPFKPFGKVQNIQAVYLSAFPYLVSPFGINEDNVQFMDSITTMHIRIMNDKFLKCVAENLEHSEKIQENCQSPIWIGLVVANPTQQLKLGLTKQGYLKRGQSYYKMNEELMQFVLDRLPWYIKHGIPPENRWGKIIAKTNR